MEKGYTEDVVTNCYYDVIDEITALLKDSTNAGSDTHIELSERLRTLSTLITANKS